MGTFWVQQLLYDVNEMKSASYDTVKWCNSTGRNDLYQTDNRAGMIDLCHFVRNVYRDKRLQVIRVVACNLLFSVVIVPGG